MLATRERGILESVYGTDAVHSIVPQYQPPQNNTLHAAQLQVTTQKRLRRFCARILDPALRPGKTLVTSSHGQSEVIISYVNVNPE